MTWWKILLIVTGSLAVWVAMSGILYKRFFKRFYDIILSLSTLLLLSPLLIFLTVFGAFAMHGNPFFTQYRPGKKGKDGNERVFKLIKFRTMSNLKDGNGNLLPDEQRLNKYGKFLRKTSLDELPELINIIKNDMSLVGPRPLLIRDLVFMTPQQRKRHNIRPGLTGLAQVNGRNNVTWEQKFQYDLCYIDNVSLIGDIRIIFKTFFKVLLRCDVNREGTESDVDLGDYLLQKNEITNEEYNEKLKEAKDYCKRQGLQ